MTPGVRAAFGNLYVKQAHGTTGAADGRLQHLMSRGRYVEAIDAH
ncbi:hypothetical protein [Streptomyces sp. ML-6]|nr:hypothetical protein [Streptomyces sp. ML-6]MDK0524221.1 hypothetical protein [Streptomyces sp. ML-6]